jgi:hypothetical protein
MEESGVLHAVQEFGTAGAVLRSYSLEGPPGKYGSSMFVESLDHSSKWINVGLASPRLGEPQAIVSLTYSAEGHLEAEHFLAVPDRKVKDVKGLGTVVDSDWVVIGGNAENPDGPFLIRSHSRTGQIDRTFGANFERWAQERRAKGRVFVMESLDVRWDSSVLIAGSEWATQGGSHIASILRFNADGTLLSDGAFGSGVTREPGLKAQAAYQAVTVSGDGYAAAYQVLAPDNMSFSAIEFADGENKVAPRTRDNLAIMSYVYACYPAGKGSVIAAGYWERSDRTRHPALLKCSPAGYDTSFGHEKNPDGGLTIKLADLEFRDVLSLTSGQILVAGQRRKHPCLLCLDATGQPDGSAVAEDIEGVGTSLAFWDDTVVMNVQTDGEGLLLLAFHVADPEPPQRPRPAPPVSTSLRTPRPVPPPTVPAAPPAAPPIDYRKSAAAEERARAHLNLQKEYQSMASTQMGVWAKRMSAGSF